MPRHKQGKNDVTRHAPKTSSRATASPSGPRWRLPLMLVLLLAGLAGVYLVYRPAKSTHVNTIADDVADATPEVAELLLEASAVVDRLMELFPDSPDALDAVAWAHQRFRKSPEAIAYWKRCLELEPDSTSALHALGVAAQESGDLETAVGYFRQAAELEPGASRHATALGESLLNLGELQEAAMVLELDLQIHPNSAPTLILVGQAYGRLKEYKKAREYLEKAIQLAPEYTSAYYELGTACRNLQDLEKAKEYLAQFQILKDRDEQAHRDLLKSTQDVNDVRTAVAEICSSAGKVLLAHGEVATAEEHLLRAMELDAELAEPRQILAWLYQKQGRADEALRELVALQERATDDSAVCLSLGEMFTQMGEFERAEQAYQKLVEISPYQSGSYIALAGLYLKANRKIPEARALALKAIDLEPVAPHYRVLSLACQLDGDQPAALAAIDKAVTLEPQDPEYRRLRRLLEKE